MPKTILMIILVIAALAVLIPLGVIVFYMTLNRTNGTIQSSGIARKYLLYVPKSYDKTKPTPLVISIHGFIEWPAHQMQISHWNKLADEHGFIVVYPSGTGIPLRWDAFPRAGGGNDGLRDVTFISDLIDKLEGDYNIDPTRIYANGLSNGGGMSFLLACKLADRIAAIGGVAGAYSTPWSECSPSRPVPVIAFHGDADPIVPYEGGTVSRAGFTFPAIAGLGRRLGAAQRVHQPAARFASQRSSQRHPLPRLRPKRRRNVLYHPRWWAFLAGRQRPAQIHRRKYHPGHRCHPGDVGFLQRAPAGRDRRLNFDASEQI